MLSANGPFHAVPLLIGLALAALNQAQSQSTDEELDALFQSCCKRAGLPPTARARCNYFGNGHKLHTLTYEALTTMVWTPAENRHVGAYMACANQQLDHRPNCARRGVPMQPCAMLCLTNTGNAWTDSPNVKLFCALQASKWRLAIVDTLRALPATTTITTTTTTPTSFTPATATFAHSDDDENRASTWLWQKMFSNPSTPPGRGSFNTDFTFSTRHPPTTPADPF